MENDGTVLTALAERLRAKMENHGYVFESHRRDDLTAQRIVAKVAEVEALNVDFLRKCADGSPEAEESAQRLQTAKRFLVDECRRIAEEGN